MEEYAPFEPLKKRGLET